MKKILIGFAITILGIFNTSANWVNRPHKAAHNTWLVINELMAENHSTIEDSTGEFDDWIELKNNLNHELQLQGLFLSNTFNRRTLYTFPPGTKIPAQGYLIVWCDSQMSQQGLHVPFTMMQTGGQLILCNSDTSVIDSVTFFKQYADTSFGLIPNGIGDYFLLPPTFNKMNVNFLSVSKLQSPWVQLYPNPCRSLVHFELKSNKYSDKSIEIYNSNSQLVYKNNFKGIETEHQIPIEDLPDGVYFLISEGNMPQRFIIKRE